MREQRRDLIAAILIAGAIVFARNAVFIFYPQSFFDSDQAIVGLMAKHLLEGRAFPLFFYGQTYLLGVEAWVMSLFFLAGGPTVAMLHTAILSFSLASVALLIVCLVRWCGLGPFQALAASLFFTLMPPFTSALLIEANGANSEPFLYIVLLWMLRDRPMWFGLVLGVGVLNREFTIYAVPVLLAIQLAAGDLFRTERLRKWIVAAVVFLAVWQGVDALKPYADLMGPGTRGRARPGASSSTVSNVMDRTEIVPQELVARGRAMLHDYFPRQLGARRNDSSSAPQGREWLFWPTMLLLAGMSGRALQRTWTSRADRARPATLFGWYLIGVGILSAVGYILTRSVTAEPVDRYMLLVLYAPIGVMGIFLALEPQVWLRRAAIVLVVGWASISAIDHTRLFARYWSGHEPDEAQALADGLAARGVTVAAAGYWRAYKLTFLTQERVIVASTDFTRIDRYDWLAQQEGDRLVVLEPRPCESDLEPINGWYLCRAGQVTDLLSVLERYWGYTSFRPLQREAMEAILEGRDSLLVLPTGGGKSICFQAPALVRDGLAVVVSPLISLMKDQVDTLVGNGVQAACYHSALSSDVKASVTIGLREGRFRLLYVAPERLVGEARGGLASLLSGQSVNFVAIDEAHCISQWGHDFRPEYRQLASLREQWPRAGMHAFTATATARVRKDIVSQLQLRDPVELVGSFDRPNLVYRVLARATLKRQLRDILARHKTHAGIIYCQSRREVDALAEWLVEEGVRAVPYHAGLTDDVRHAHQDRFLNEDVEVVVATVAFGMGIDRSDVRFVVHAGAPQSLEHYQQESGRAGRDGLEAECVLVYSAADFIKWRMMLEKNGEWNDARRALMRDIERYASSVGCRHKRLVGYFGERYAKSDCAACDFCLGELEAVADAPTTARKILSAVARVQQRFGAAHVTNVLRGSDSEQVRARGHEQLSVFGLLRDASIDEVRGYIDQLVALGFLRQTEDAYPVLHLTNEGLALIRDAGAAPDLVLARQRKPEKDKLPKRSRVEAESWEGVDRELFEALRAFRLRVARERGVPPYVIFHDTTLRELARLKPTTLEALRHVYGVGARKADDLGEGVLETVRKSAGESVPS